MVLLLPNNAVGAKVSNLVVQQSAQSQTLTEYLARGFQYIDSRLEFFPTPEGYVNVTEDQLYNYVYNYTDHLGNLRLSYTFDQDTQSLTVLQENHYYPFGMKHSNYGVSETDYLHDETTGQIYAIIEPVASNKFKYKYNGKEFQDELGLNFYDYGARNYDPTIGRWMNIDPLAETSRRYSPYTYALNNPVFFIDPDGMEAQSSSGQESMTKDDIDVMVDIGYGRMREVSQISGAIGYSGATADFNEKGLEKIDNNARKYLEWANYNPDENISDVEFKESYAKTMREAVYPLHLLYEDAGNPNIKYVPRIEGATAEYTTENKTVTVTDYSFFTNLTLFYDLIHEGMHAWDHNKGAFKMWGWDGNHKSYPLQMRAATEVRAYQIERWFGNQKRSEGLYQTYLEIANKKFANYQIRSFPVFFQNIQSN